jgi:hypothetical protein
VTLRQFLVKVTLDVISNTARLFRTMFARTHTWRPVNVTDCTDCWYSIVKEHRLHKIQRQAAGWKPLRYSDNIHRMTQKCVKICNQERKLKYRSLLFMSTEWDCRWTVATYGLIVFPRRWTTEPKWNKEKNEEPRENPVPVPLYPLQIPHGLNRASAVKHRWQTAWSMART